MCILSRVLRLQKASQGYKKWAFQKPREKLKDSDDLSSEVPEYLIYHIQLAKQISTQALIQRKE